MSLDYQRAVSARVSHQSVNRGFVPTPACSWAKTVGTSAGAGQSSVATCSSSCDGKRERAGGEIVFVRHGILPKAQQLNDGRTMRGIK